MRPINKGESPYKKINEYKDALPYLERRIGMYCSYCEFSIPHVPEVEHVVSKSKGGDLTDWNNLNLGCKYCNTRKKAQVLISFTALIPLFGGIIGCWVAFFLILMISPVKDSPAESLAGSPFESFSHILSRINLVLSSSL